MCAKEKLKSEKKGGYIKPYSNCNSFSTRSLVKPDDNFEEDHLL